MRIRDRVSLVMAGFLILAVVGFGVLYSQAERHALQDALDSELHTAALLAKEILPPGYHERITGPGSVPDAEYRQIVDRFNRVCTQANLENLWTVMVLNGRVVFTSATSPGKDARKRDQAAFLEVHSNPEWYTRAFATMQPQYQVNEDQWGRVRAVLVPFRDARGRPWLVGASRDLRRVEAQLHATVRTSLGVGGVMLLLGIGACLLLANSLARPLEEMTRVAAGIAAGDLAQRAPIGGARELKLLATSLNTMSHAIGERIRELAEHREDLRITLHSIGDAVIATDAHGVVTRMNPVAEALTGWRQEEAQDRPLRDVFRIVNADSRQPVEDPVALVLAQGRVVGLANHTVLIERGGRERQIADSAAPIRDNAGALAGVVLVFRDVTEEYAKDRALAESEARFRSLFETMMEGVALHEVVLAPGGSPADYRLLDVNPAYEQHTGIRRAEAKNALASVLYQTGSPPYLEVFAEVARTGQARSFETFFPPLQRHFRVSVCSPKPGQFATLFTDISEAKRVEEALRASERAARESQTRFLTFMRYLPACVFIKDAQSRLLYANQPLQDLFGWHDCEGKLTEELVPAALAEPMKAADRKTLAEGASVIEERLCDPQGLEHVFETHKFPILIEGQPPLVAGIAVDITQRARMEQQLRTSLAEKTALLKEVHHRVKNNLQVVSSLLNLQAVRSKNAELADGLRQTQRRIRSMALLHESLYRSESLARVPLAPYLRNLCRHLFNSFGPPALRIAPRFHLEEVSLALDQAIPCGLLVNELLSNALKHAFPNERAGEIVLELRASAEGVSVQVADDGVGLPPDLDLLQAESLGLRLVASLTQQLGGRLEVRRERGTTVRVVFPPPPEDSSPGAKNPD